MAEPVELDRGASAEPAAWLDGTDPAGWADTVGATDPFPPGIDLGVRPPDGRWADPNLLGGAADAADDPSTDPPEALRADLAAADGDPTADWATLRQSDDPAVRALALRWHPNP